MANEDTSNINWPNPPGILGAGRASDRAARRLQEQASDLGLSIDEYRELLAESPRYVRTLHERAAGTSTTIKELWDDDRRAAGNLEYPGPDCLRPHEVEQFLEGTLPEGRLVHTETCIPCSVLLEGARVVPDASSIINEIRNIAARSLAAQTDLQDSRPSREPVQQPSVAGAVTEALVVALSFLIPALLVRA